MTKTQKLDRTAKSNSKHGRYIRTKEHNVKMDIQQRTEGGNELSVTGNER